MKNIALAAEYCRIIGVKRIGILHSAFFTKNQPTFLPKGTSQVLNRELIVECINNPWPEGSVCFCTLLSTIKTISLTIKVNWEEGGGGLASVSGIGAGYAEASFSFTSESSKTLHKRRSTKLKLLWPTRQREVPKILIYAIQACSIQWTPQRSEFITNFIAVLQVNKFREIYGNWTLNNTCNKRHF